MDLSIVSPVYNAEKILPELVRRISEVCDKQKYDYEVILVEDHGNDQSWDKIVELAKLYPRLRGFKLSKNFGQHYAITAGIGQSQGDLLVIIDCDLQENPDYIPEMVHQARQGYNVVCTIKKTKKYNWYRRFTSDLFYKVLNSLSDVTLENNLGTMTLIDKKVKSEYLKIKDYHRHSNLIFSWLGFKRGYVFVDHEDRYEGKSSYTISKLLKHALNGVISQSDKLLRWSITAGLIMFIASLLGVLYIVVKSFFHTFALGWPSLVVLILFTTGIILLMLGILGIYIGKIFDQVKGRPLYIISEETQQS